MLNAINTINPSKVAIYIRWSTDDQANGTTLENQLETCQKFLAYKNWEYREEFVFIDNGYSGGNMNRPGMTDLREKVQAGEVECVVVYKLDRLSRSLLDTVKLVREEWADKCVLYSTQEDFNTNTSVGQMIFNILVSFAEFERNVIRERTMSGKTKRAEQGRNAGQKYHYGYVGDEHGNWLLHGWDEQSQSFTGEAAIVRRIFDEYLSGIGGNTIAEGLRNEGVPAPNGGKWSSTSVYMILDQAAYMGTYVYGQWKKVKGRYRKGDPAHKKEGVVPPIVTDAEWEQVQRLRKERSTMHRRTLSLKNEYLLTGMLRCAECGAVMVGHNNKTKRYYRCNGEKTYKSCDCGVIISVDLEQAIISEVRQQFSPQGIRAMVSEIEASLCQEAKAKEYAVTSLEAQIASLTRKHNKLEDDYFKEELDAKTYTRLSERLEKELAQAAERLVAAQEALRQSQEAKVDTDYLRKLAARLDVWDTLSTEEVRMILREVVAEVKAYRPKVGSGQTSQVQLTWRPRLDLTTHKAA